jgi:PEP-CTERM motif
MTSRKLLARAAILAIAVVLFTLPVSARGDTYQILALQTDNSHNLFGIDTAGDVVIFNAASDCAILGASVSSCYQTFVDGVLSSESTTVPSLAYDDGTPCVPSFPPGTFSVVHGVCNNGREAFFALDPFPGGLFTGPDPVADRLSGEADTIFLNASGDIAWSDSAQEEIFEAVDVTTDVVPEPSTLILLATGVLGATRALPRRFVRITL